MEKRFMSTEEFKASKQYAEYMDRIRNYPKGFEFTLPYWKMTKQIRNAIDIITRDAEKEHLIESISIGISLDLEETEETFKRI